MGDSEQIQICYQLTFMDGESVAIEVPLDGRTLALAWDQISSPPEWTRLRCAQCPECRLPASAHVYCPVATSLVKVVERFTRRVSYEPVALTVVTFERKTVARTTLQAALGSLLGILMVTSGCPTLDKLRPMVRFHLPLATDHETVYRAASMYLMAQYLRTRDGLRPDWTLEGLERIYDDVHRVNLAVARRIREAAVSDAHANALTRLDLFADGVAWSIRDSLSELRYLFPAYLE